MNRLITFGNVSRFYGEVLGVNRVNLTIPPGVTSLVGPNGSGKTTLMNLMSGLIFPTQGEIQVLGISPAHPERLGRVLGYCAQFDAFPKGMSGYEFIYGYLRVHGLTHAESDRRTWESLERVSMKEAAERPVAAYSKGMRQRIKLAQAIAHDPRVLVLDEPLNGLDPMARAETIALFKQWGEDGRHVIVSSHILHEVDRISDQVVRCDKPSMLSARLFQQDHIVEAKIAEDKAGVLLRTTDADRFYLLLNKLVMETGLVVEMVAPADDDVNSVHQYLIGGSGEGGTA